MAPNLNRSQIMRQRAVKDAAAVFFPRGCGFRRENRGWATKNAIANQLQKQEDDKWRRMPSSEHAANPIPSTDSGDGAGTNVGKTVAIIRRSPLSNLAPWTRRDVEPLLREGERVTNEVGDTVCFVARDVFAGEPGPMLSQFRRWVSKAPVPGAPAGPGFRMTDDDKLQVCIEGQWRP